MKPRPHCAAKSSKMASDGGDCFRYNFALVSRIANAFATSSSFDLKKGQTVDIDKARHEHEELVEALRRIGLDVIELPSDEKHPDGLFVDDIAVVIHGTALICNPPTLNDRPTRQGEVSGNIGLSQQINVHQSDQLMNSLPSHEHAELCHNLKSLTSS